MTQKKRILYVHHAGGFGGAPKSMSYIIKNLDQKKYEPILLNIAQGPINDFFRELPCKLIVPKKGIRPFHGSYVVKTNLYHYLYGWFFLLPSIILAYRQIKRIQPDLIHLNSTCLFAFAIASYFLKVETICHVREPIRKNYAGWPLRYFNKKFVSGFIAISQYDLNSLLLKEKSRKPREVIYNFVEKFDDSSLDEGNLFRKELNLKTGDILFLYLARFADSNGWKELISMAKKALSVNDNCHFALVGAKDKSHFIDTGSDKIKILPFRTDVENILKASDVFVCPFVLPHFARGVIEAGAYGKPSIGSNVGGVNELIKPQVTGLLYKSKKEFIDCCDILVKDVKYRQRLGENAYSFAIENFDLIKNLERTYTFYTNFI